MGIIYEWWMKPARRWQFWLPQSGILGGMILGAIIIAIAFIILFR
jgi:hypothetical protein